MAHAAELPEFKKRLPLAMQVEMDQFDLQQRQLKSEKRESAKKRKLERKAAEEEFDVEIEVTGLEDAEAMEE